MPLWRYTAIPLADTPSGTTPRGRKETTRGQLAGATAADVRAALRRIGLQPVKVQPMRKWRLHRPGGSALGSINESLESMWHRQLRRRRRVTRADLYDSLATMLASGMPILEALDTLVATDRRRGHRQRAARGGPRQTMLLDLHAQLRGGATLHEAMASHSGWFSPVDLAMIEAGHRSGRLPAVLVQLSSREARLDALGQQLAAALTYPALITIVAVAVAVFLSTHTLPDLTTLLVEAGLETPRLTSGLMVTGQLLATWWWLAVATPVFVVLSSVILIKLVGADTLLRLQRLMRRITPLTVRRKALAEATREWAALVGSGIPVGESLRILAPVVSGGLRRALQIASDRLEDGLDLSEALDDPVWFEPEFRRTLQIGQDAGELERMLERIADRYERQANRLIDRAATLLEPCAILFLAGLVGLVVMAAVLPLLRLQEMV